VNRSFSPNEECANWWISSITKRRRRTARPRHVERLLDLRDLTVSDVMIHRTEMVTVRADDPPETW